MTEGERTLAAFIDFENLALGFRGKKDKRFEIQKVLERLVEKGKIIVKKAYADWANYAEYKRPLHEAAIELIEIPKPVLEQATRVSLQFDPKYGAGVDVFNALVRQVDRKDQSYKT